MAVRAETIGWTEGHRLARWMTPGTVTYRTAVAPAAPAIPTITAIRVVELQTRTVRRAERRAMHLLRRDRILHDPAPPNAAVAKPVNRCTEKGFAATTSAGHSIHCTMAGCTSRPESQAATPPSIARYVEGAHAQFRVTT